MITYALFTVLYSCYNCGEFANHIAARCPQARQPKRCHHCKSEEHLVADCPHRPSRSGAGSPPPPAPGSPPPPAHQSDSWRTAGTPHGAVATTTTTVRDLLGEGAMLGLACLPGHCSSDWRDPFSARSRSCVRRTTDGALIDELGYSKTLLRQTVSRLTQLILYAVIRSRLL